MTTSFICQACGTQYPPRENPPSMSPICADDWQYIPPGGQTWTTLQELRVGHTNRR